MGFKSHFLTFNFHLKILIECCELLLKSDKSATQILGPIDAMKLKSSMTLFDTLHPNEIYEKF